MPSTTLARQSTTSSSEASGKTVCVCVYRPVMLFLSALDALMEGSDLDEKIDYLKAAVMNQAITSFKTVLEAEFQTAGVYLVTAKRGYDVPTLLEHAEAIFPDELCEKLPQVRNDLREAGRCIAFSLGTAAGFHLLRALESVVCAYWYEVMNKAPLPANRNLGQYILQMAKGDHPERKKVLFALRQVKELHRNSIMHPEESLDVDQAVALLSSVQGAVSMMLPFIKSDEGRLLMDASAEKSLRQYDEGEAKLAEEEQHRRNSALKQRKTERKADISQV